MIIDTFQKYAALCWKCRGRGPEAYDKETAQRKAREAGWVELKGKTLCPDPECRALPDKKVAR